MIEHNRRLMQVQGFVECTIPGRWSARFSVEKVRVFCIWSEIFVMANFVSFRISRSLESIEFPTEWWYFLLWAITRRLSSKPPKMTYIFTHALSPPRYHRKYDSRHNQSSSKMHICILNGTVVEEPRRSTRREKQWRTCVGCACECVFLEFLSPWFLVAHIFFSAQVVEHTEKDRISRDGVCATLLCTPTKYPGWVSLIFSHLCHSQNILKRSLVVGCHCASCGNMYTKEEWKSGGQNRRASRWTEWKQVKMVNVRVFTGFDVFSICFSWLCYRRTHRGSTPVEYIHRHNWTRRERGPQWRLREMPCDFGE